MGPDPTEREALSAARVRPPSRGTEVVRGERSAPERLALMLFVLLGAGLGLAWLVWLMD